MDQRIAVRRFANLLEDGRTLRIIGGATPSQDQLTLRGPSHELVGPDDTDRILQAVEARDLRHDGPIVPDPQMRQHGLDLSVRHRPVLLRQGIDSRVDQVLRDGEELGEFRRREH